MFTLFAVPQGLSVVSFMPVHMLAPAAARHHGLSEAEAALVLSAVAGGDYVGRLTSGSSSTFRAYDVVATARSAPPCSSWPSACYCGRSSCPSEPPWSTPSCSDGSSASPLLNAPTCCAISSAPIVCPAPWACVSPPHRVSESSSVIRRR